MASGATANRAGCRSASAAEAKGGFPDGDLCLTLSARGRRIIRHVCGLDPSVGGVRGGRDRPDDLLAAG